MLYIESEVSQMIVRELVTCDAPELHKWAFCNTHKTFTAFWNLKRMWAIIVHYSQHAVMFIIYTE